MIRDIQIRYRTDPLVRQMVDFLESQIEALALTPGEIRDCAMLAAFNHEMRRFMPNTFFVDATATQEFRR